MPNRLFFESGASPRDIKLFHRFESYTVRVEIRDNPYARIEFIEFVPLKLSDNICENLPEIIL